MTQVLAKSRLKSGIWSDVFLPFFFSRLSIFVAGQLALAWGTVLPGYWRASQKSWIDMWARWDVGWYFGIALRGYEYVPGEQSNVAFLPLFPLVLRLFSFGSQNREILVITGWIFSNLATLVAFYFLYRLTLLDYSLVTARRTIWLLAFFPTSYYLSVPYSEGLFLALTVTAFYAARKRFWLIAGLLAGLSAATRVSGILLIMPLAWEWYQQRPRRWLSVWPLVLIPMGLAAYMLYLDLNFGDPLLFSTVRANWGRTLSATGVMDNIIQLFTAPDPLQRAQAAALELSFAVLSIFLFINVLRRQRLSYGLFAGYSIAVPLASIRVVSYSRYMMVTFPLFIAMAQIFSRPALYRLALFAMGLLQFVMVTRWTLWYWVA